MAKDTHVEVDGRELKLTNLDKVLYPAAGFTKGEMVDYYDEENGISAMERSTGYSLSITGQMQARGEIGKAGVFTPDEAMPPEKYIKELALRGVMIREMR